MSATSSAQAPRRALLRQGAIALLALAPVARAQPSDAQREALRRDAQALAARHHRALVELAERLGRVEIDIGPEALVSARGLARAREGIARFRAILAERSALVRRAIAETDTLYRAGSPAWPSTSAQPAVFGMDRADALRIFDGLNASLSRYIDALAGFVDWCERQRGKLVLVAGHLEFATDKLLTEFQQRLASVQAAGERAEADKSASVAALGRAKEGRQARDGASTRVVVE